MFLIKFLIAAFTFFNFLSASSFTQRGPTGLRNRQNICYMNALLSALYDVTPFRKAVYDNFDNEEFVLARALAGVFARKQLNLVPALDLERDFMVTVKRVLPDWQFGVFQDIDEFFTSIFKHFPEPIANSIGFVERNEISTDNGRYIINEGNVIRSPMITVYLPDVPIKGLRIQDLVTGYMSQKETLQFRINRDEHPAYFQLHNIHWSQYEKDILVEKQPKVSEYSNVVPVFIARRTVVSGSNARDFRNDRLDIPEFLHLPLQDGQIEEFTLISFAAFHPSHYYAYGKSYTETTDGWYLYNDETVDKPKTSDIIDKLEKNAVMLFYVKKKKHVACRIPEAIEKWSITSLIVQHIRDRLVPRIKKMIKKAKKADKRRG